MRKQLCEALCAMARTDDSMFFFTGDLGFRALEPLRDALGERFVNAGVAEQNMISVAAAMARDGWRPWCYSIAPFCFARPFEQIRNDVCLHHLGVRLIGNGGGYGYGVMGPTHHAVDDYGALLTLPRIRVFVPVFTEDVVPVVTRMAASDDPGYLRLGQGVLPEDESAPAYAPWRRVLGGGGPAAVAVGPMAGVAWGALRVLPEAVRPELWALAELPVSPTELPDGLLARLSAGAPLTVIEEHVAHGGAGQMLAYALLLRGVAPRVFTHLCARGLDLGEYGSQQFLRERCGLSPEAIREHFLTMAGGKGA